MAPASAPASAAFCAWLRALISMPTSIASMLAPMSARPPAPTKTRENPDSSFANLRRRGNRMTAPPRRCLLKAFFLLTLGFVGGLRLLQAGSGLGHRLFMLLELVLALAFGLRILLRDDGFTLGALGVELVLPRTVHGSLLVGNTLASAALWAASVCSAAACLS